MTESVTGNVKKIWQNDKNHVIVLEDDFRLSGFGECPQGLVEGESYTFDYTKKDKWNNYKSFRKPGEAAPPDLKKLAEKATREFKNSELGTSPDSAFGMCFNNACLFTFEIMKESPLNESFDEIFDKTFEKIWTKMIQKRKEKLG